MKLKWAFKQLLVIVSFLTFSAPGLTSDFNEVCEVTNPFEKGACFSVSIGKIKRKAYLRQWQGGGYTFLPITGLSVDEFGNARIKCNGRIYDVKILTNDMLRNRCGCCIVEVPED